MRNICRKIYKKLKLYASINWIKTLYINCKFFPISEALQFPIIVFGACSFKSLKGKLNVHIPIQTGIITFGHKFEIFTKEAGISEVFWEGNWDLYGKIQFGYDVKLYIEKEATFQHGNWCSFANNTRLVCSNSVILGDNVKIGDFTHCVDTNFHDLLNLETQTNLPKKGSIKIGSNVNIGANSMIMRNTILPNYSMVGSMSLCNKDYTLFGEHNFYAGIPARLVRENYGRDWEKEQKDVEEFLTIRL